MTNSTISSFDETVDTLTKLLKGREATITPIRIKYKLPSLCVIFGNAEEASPSDFSILRTFSIENGYDFKEDTDYKHNRKLFFYILEMSEAPF